MKGQTKTMKTKQLPAIITLLLLASLAPLQSAELHVSVSGSDANPGTQAAALQTIQHAADLARPGDTITVHQGIYRERISPPRGGESDAKRIVFQAAAGEKVEIAGSEIIKNWDRAGDDVWKTVVPNSFFGGFNPFKDVLFGDWYEAHKGRTNHTGMVYVNGVWSFETATREELMNPGSVALTEGDPWIINVASIRPKPQQGEVPVVAAETYAENNHKVGVAPCEEGGKCVGFIKRTTWLKYNNVDFGSGSSKVEIRLAGAGAKVELRLGSAEGELLGSCVAGDTGGWQKWCSYEVPIRKMTGKHPLVIVFQAKETAQCWFATVDEANTTILLRLPSAIDPNRETTEINVRRTVFYPEQPGVNYITVRGFTLRDAATPWAPPTAEQRGIIGTHWSKGWVIENNTIYHSICSGVALGKYGDEWDNKACLPTTQGGSANAYVDTVKRALKEGWGKEKIGSHVVRNNRIYKCGQTGIVGSLGAAFSTITGNEIFNIYSEFAPRMFGGCEQAGIKFHGAVDVIIARNHIHQCGAFGLWLDWMAQGTRVSCNVMHECAGLFMEVNHGPILVDNNIFACDLLSHSQGIALVHNLVTGSLWDQADDRVTPNFKPHSTELVNFYEPNPFGDKRYLNNLFLRADMTFYDKKLNDHNKPIDLIPPLRLDGNVYAGSAKPSLKENQPIVFSNVTATVAIVEKNGHWVMKANPELIAAMQKRASGGNKSDLVTTETLGETTVSHELFENPDGSPLKIDADYFGNKRNESNPMPGPFESAGAEDVKVWPNPFH